MWEEVIDELADRIFWDRDWQVSTIASELLDGVEAEFIQVTGLDEKYLVNRLPSGAGKQVELPLTERALLALAEIRAWTLDS